MGLRNIRADESLYLTAISTSLNRANATSSKFSREAGCLNPTRSENFDFKFNNTIYVSIHYYLGGPSHVTRQLPSGLHAYPQFPSRKACLLFLILASGWSTLSASLFPNFLLMLPNLFFRKARNPAFLLNFVFFPIPEPWVLSVGCL